MDIFFRNKENQDYYNWCDHKYIACKYNGGLEQDTLELVSNIILEEEDDHWNNTSYTPMEGDETRGSHTFYVDNCVFNITKTKRNGKSKTRIVREVSELNDKSDFILANINHKYRTFEANY